MNETLVLHGLLHVALVKVAFADIKPQGIAKDSLSSHWVGFGLYEAALGGMLILVVASAGVASLARARAGARARARATCVKDPTEVAQQIAQPCGGSQRYTGL